MCDEVLTATGALLPPQGASQGNRSCVCRIVADRVSSYRAGCWIVCVGVFKLAKPVKKHCRLSTIAGSSLAWWA